MAEDEGRFGSTGKLCSCWCPPGDMRPTLTRQQVKQYVYIYEKGCSKFGADLLLDLAPHQHGNNEFIIDTVIV